MSQDTQDDARLMLSYMQRAKSSLNQAGEYASLIGDKRLLTELRSLRDRLGVIHADIKSKLRPDQG